MGEKRRLGLEIVKSEGNGTKFILGGLEIPYVESYKIEPMLPFCGNLAELTLKVSVEFPIIQESIS